MSEEKKYVVVATKVSPDANSRLEALAASKELTKYELIQMVCDTLIRYMDDRHNLTAEMEQAMSIFEHMTGWKNAFNLADPTTDPQVEEATYYLVSSGKKGFRAVHVTRPFMGDWQEDANIQRIIERTINLITPERYMRLRRLAVDFECSSLLELMDKLIDMHSDDVDLHEFRKTFEDANRTDNGKPLEYGAKTKSVHYKGIEG